MRRHIKLIPSFIQDCLQRAPAKPGVRRPAATLPTARSGWGGAKLGCGSGERRSQRECVGTRPGTGAPARLPQQPAQLGGRSPASPDEGGGTGEQAKRSPQGRRPALCPRVSGEAASPQDAQGRRPEEWGRKAVVASSDHRGRKPAPAGRHRRALGAFFPTSKAYYQTVELLTHLIGRPALPPESETR